MDHAIHAEFHRAHRLLHRLCAHAVALHTLSEKIMADTQDELNELQKMSNVIVAFEQREAATIAALQTALADAKAQLAAGVDTQPFIDQMEAILATIPAATPPVAPPAP